MNLAQLMKNRFTRRSSDRSIYFSTGSDASQQNISVPRCLFLSARDAVEAVKSLAPKLPGVLRGSSRTVRFPTFSRATSDSARAANGLQGICDRH